MSDSGSAANALVLQSDGKIVAVGNATIGRRDAFAVVRYNKDGTLDSTFGIGGKVITAIGQTGDVANAVGIQADGKIIVAGKKRNGLINVIDVDFAVARYNSNGKLDSSFGINGIATTDFESRDDEAYSLSINSKGKILLAGFAQTAIGGDNFGLVQYNPNGSLDSTFGINGKVYTDVNANSGDAIHAVIFQTDGKILAGGNTSGKATKHDFAVVRYLENGKIDTSFGLNGIVITDFGGSDDYGRSLSLHTNGKIVIAGDLFDAQHLKVALARYTVNGIPDSTFGTDGKVTSSFDNKLEGAGSSVHVQPDGKILVTGGTGIQDDNGDIGLLNFALLRYNKDGSPDNGFGKNGVITTDFQGFNDLSNTSLIMPDGKILVAGYSSSTPEHTDFALARYERNALLNYNTLKGSVFIDNNLNGTREVDEPFYNNAKTVTIKRGIDTITAIANTGKFTLDVDTGSYITTVQPVVPYYNVVPSTFTTTHSNYFNTDSISFALQPIAGKNDLVICLIPVTAARPGFNIQYRIQWRNQGTKTFDDFTIQLVKPGSLNFISSSFVPTTINRDTLRWNFAGSNPFETGNIFINFKVAAPPATNNGDTLRLTATIFPVIGDVTPANNVSSLVQKAVGSYDPNDKSESHGGVIKPEHLTNGEFLTYIIRYQNTGTDTAFNVRIRDTLSNKLDWNTLEMISASHGYQLNIKNANQCTWSFNNIRLVDSIKNEGASHGYLVYKIKPKPTLAPGDTVYNLASIYFDYNLPVATNKERTTIANVVLPIKLLTFNAKKEGKNNVIDWSTTQQINFSHFEVERSVNGRDFIALGKVSANNMYRYGLTDYDPAKAINYYRLKMMDRDGSFEYSTVRTINNSGNFYVSIYPNPAKENLNVKIESDKKETLYLEIISLDGKVLVTKQAIVSSSTLVNINIKALAFGSHFLRVTSAGNEQTALRFDKL